MDIRHALFTLSLGVLAAAPARAQSHRATPRAKAAMWAALELTAAQQTRVEAIHSKYAPAVKAAQKAAADSAARINARELEEVRGILTMQQQETFDAYISGRTHTRRARATKVAPARISIPH
jgi:hypothetical protein